MTYVPMSKIDDLATNGLAGVNNSLAYRVHEIERHLHSYELWCEKHSSQSGEVTIADRVGSGAGAFQLDAGNTVWGSWVQILGSGDTPLVGSAVKYDLHMIQVEGTERTQTYFIQIGFGASGAAALSANDISDIVYTPATNQVDSGPIVFQSRRQAATTKAWARTKCPGQNTATIDIYFGLHEYEG